MELRHARKGYVDSAPDGKMRSMGRGRLEWLLRDPRGRIKRLGLRLTVIWPRTALQKRRMLARPELSPSARELLQKTDSRLHPYEDMYTGDGFPYFWAGLGAIRNIENALETAGVEAPDAILDMPCGFGRVIRSLVARFPQASITACDIRPRAVRFCTRRFAAEGVISSAAFEEIALPRAFDLIWCGSLATHLDSPQTLSLVDLFVRSARSGAVIVFTTHGESVVEKMRAGVDYMLTTHGVELVLGAYERSGYGYANYPWDSAYGVAAISPDWIRRNIEGRSGLHEIYFEERGWGRHHDVFGFLKP
jgi:SAM-dependent methyltransferase